MRIRIDYFVPMSNGESKLIYSAFSLSVPDKSHRIKFDGYPKPLRITNIIYNTNTGSYEVWLNYIIQVPNHRASISRSLSLLLVNSLESIKRKLLDGLYHRY